MFETEKSRREFIAALRAGKIAPPILQRALTATAAFSDCTMEEIGWTLSHQLPLVQEFGAAVMAVMDDPGRLPFLMDQFLKERTPQRIEELAQAIAACKPKDLGSQLSLWVNDAKIESRLKALALLVRMEDWPRQKGLVQALLDDPKPEVSDKILLQVLRTAPRLYLKALRQAAAHAQEEVRTLALKTLIGLNSLKHADVLLERLPRETGELQKSVYGALMMGIKQDPTGMTEVIVAALASTETAVRGAALNLLLKLPDPVVAFRRALQFSESLGAGPRDELFAEMTKAPEMWADLVLALVKVENHASLRLQAMTLARALKHPKLVPLFLHELKNPDWMVRYTAMQVLGDMQSQQALPLLVEALNQEESAMAAIQALDKYKDIRLAKPFLTRLPLAGEAEQIELLKALQNLGDARLLPNIAKFLESKELKGKAPKFAAETVIALCTSTGTPVPERVTQIYESLREKTVSDLPDLGLRLSD